MKNNSNDAEFNEIRRVIRKRIRGRGLSPAADALAIAVWRYRIANANGAGGEKLNPRHPLASMLSKEREHLAALRNVYEHMTAHFGRRVAENGFFECNAAFVDEALAFVDRALNRNETMGVVNSIKKSRVPRGYSLRSSRNIYHWTREVNTGKGPNGSTWPARAAVFVMDRVFFEINPESQPSDRAASILEILIETGNHLDVRENGDAWEAAKKAICADVNKAGRDKSLRIKSLTDPGNE